MIYEIRKYGDPVLREEGHAVDQVTDELRTLAEDMLETMYQARGIGLAAQQIGETRMITVLDVPPEADADEEGAPLNEGIAMPLVLINPEILDQSEDVDSAEEGCLSFPEIGVQVTRPCEVSVSYLDRDGAERRLEARGLLARAIQHEIDHLHGKLFIDYASHVKKIALKGKLKRLRRETEQRLGLV